MDAVSVGLGIAIGVAALSPFVVSAIRAEQRERKAERRREQEARDTVIFKRVEDMLARYAADARAPDPEDGPITKARRPHREQDALTAALWQYTDMVKQAEKFRETLEYIKLGGHPDDEPARVIETMKGKGNK